MELLKNVSGKVLDLGSGGGAYLDYLLVNPAVTSIVALEPNINMHDAIKKRVERLRGEGKGGNTEVVVDGRFLHEIEGVEMFDWCIIGNVLCEVPDQEDTFRELERVVKKGGYLYFSEHCIYPSGLMRLVQQVVSPVWRVVNDGCNIDRDTLNNMKKKTRWEIQSWSFDEVMPLVGTMEVGIAMKPLSVPDHSQ